MGKIEHARLMDPIESWVDPQEVKRLAEALMNPMARTNAPSDEATYSKQFVGFDASQGAKQSMTPGVSFPDSTAATGNSVPGSVHGSMAQQLTRFRQSQSWASLVKGLFAITTSAHLIYDDGDHQYLHFVARNWLKTQSTPSNQHVQLRVGSTDFLTLISIQTGNEVMALGLIASPGLTNDEVERIRRSLAAFLSASSS